jgi:hypothetical protein
MTISALYLGLAMLAGAVLGMLALLFALGAFRKDDTHITDEHEDMTL